MKRWFVLASLPTSVLDCYEQTNDQIHHHGEMDGDALKRLASTDPIIIVITSHAWSCVDVILPKVKPALLREALPHMVEDRIISSADDIHCVLPAAYMPNETTTVLVLDKIWMQDWCDWAQTHALTMQAMIPAYTLLPMTPEHVSILSHNDTLWIRDSILQGYCLSRAWSQNLLPKLVAHAHVDSLGDWDEALTSLFTATYPQMMRLQDCLVQTESFPINFLQGHYKLKAAKREWKVDAMAISLGCLGIALLMHMGYLGVSTWVLSSRLEQLQSQSLTLYQKVYPDATVVSSPKVLITRALQGSSGDSLFSELLAQVSEAVASHPMAIAQLHYQDTRLTLSGSLNDFESVERLTNALKSMGLSVEQQRAQQENGKIEVSLLISRGQS